MDKLWKAIRPTCALQVRICGFWFLFGSIAFAAFNPWWQVNVLLGILITGIGIGLGNWEGGE
ncbi:hypothetical protein [Paraeggerthella sp. Marseille-Q4926]|uniref:hypothetical protein n=1 Tax=unclassified Paraeggerthella TaxID=2641972 RepID=UPI001CE49C4C|nr:hypothetical protein [Paraeggerthella sp. Marseille-Q4926]